MLGPAGQNANLGTVELINVRVPTHDSGCLVT